MGPCNIEQKTLNLPSKHYTINTQVCNTNIFSLSSVTFSFSVHHTPQQRNIICRMSSFSSFTNWTINLNLMIFGTSSAVVGHLIILCSWFDYFCSAQFKTAKKGQRGNPSYRWHRNSISSFATNFTCYFTWANCTKLFFNVVFISVVLKNKNKKGQISFIVIPQKTVNTLKIWIFNLFSLVNATLHSYVLIIINVQ